MKTEDLMILGLAGIAVWMILKTGRATGANLRGLSPNLQAQADKFGAAGGGLLWPDTEAAYNGTWTSSGPFNLANYDRQIYD